MSIKTRLRDLEHRALPKPEFRCVIQINSADGTAKPTNEEVDRRVAEWEAEGIEPFVIRITTSGPAAKE